MGKYILRRLVISVLTLWLLATASFFLLRVLPGNPFQTEKLLTVEMQQKMIHYYGLDKPMLEQYVTYMGNLLHGDMGYSMKFTNRTVNSIITSGFPVSAALGLRALAVALPIGLFLGILSARKRGKAMDYLAVLVSVIGVSIPSFIMGTFLQYIFAVQLKILPIAQWKGEAYAILPTAALALALLASLTRVMRASMFDQAWDFNNATDALKAAEMFDSTYQGLPIVYSADQAGKEITEHYLNGTVINVNRGFGISVNCQYPERLVQFMEKMLNDDWQKNIWWGVEGEDYYVENGRFLRTYDQIQNAANAVWKNANSAYVLTNSMPKKQGEMDDGNKWDPLVQPECYFLQMNDYDKTFLGHYNMQRPLDFFNAPITLAPYGEAWQIDVTVDQAANDAKAAFQDTERKMLPQIIMCDEAEFDAKWTEFVDAVNAIPVSDFVDFMQAQILKLVEKNTTK